MKWDMPIRPIESGPLTDREIGELHGFLLAEDGPENPMDFYTFDGFICAVLSEVIHLYGTEGGWERLKELARRATIALHAIRLRLIRLPLRLATSSLLACPARPAGKNSAATGLRTSRCIRQPN
jgi:hypothetical protein